MCAHQLSLFDPPQDAPSPASTRPRLVLPPADPDPDRGLTLDEVRALQDLGHCIVGAGSPAGMLTLETSNGHRWQAVAGALRRMVAAARAFPRGVRVVTADGPGLSTGTSHGVYTGMVGVWLDGLSMTAPLRYYDYETLLSGEGA